MTEKDLAKYKKLLLERRDKVVSGIKHIADDNLKQSQRDSSGDISGYTHHMADMATDAYNRELSLNVAGTERQLLIDIEDALKRIDENTFGNCLDCEKSITKQRLTAIPYAKLCIKCQKEQEENGQAR